MVRTSFLLSFVILNGCSTTRSFRAPDGSIAYEISCNGGMRSMADCYDSAADFCGGKYDILSSNEGTSAFIKSGSTLVPVSKRSVMVSCK